MVTIMVALMCNLCIFIPIYYAFVHVKSQFILSVMLHHTSLTLNLLTTTIVVPPSNASKWHLGFNSAFKGLKMEAFPLVVSHLCSCWLV